MTFGTFQQTGPNGILRPSTDRWTSNHRPAARLTFGGMPVDGGAGIS
jgi:hypothetical protein